MASTLYLTATQERSGKSAVAVGLADLLSQRAGRVGVFRPLVASRTEPDPLLALLASRLGENGQRRQAFGATYDDVHAHPDRAMEAVVERFHELAHEVDTVLVVGSDFTDVASPTELSYNFRVAANIDAAVLIVLGAGDRSVEDLVTTAEVALGEAKERHARVVGLVANRADHDRLPDIEKALQHRFADLSVSVLPDSQLLSAPTVRQLMLAGHGRLVHGDEAGLDRESLGLVVAAMTLPHVLDRLLADGVVITPADREDVVLGVLLAHQSRTFPTLSGMVLNGGFSLPSQVERLIEGLDVDLPIVSVETGTMDTVRALSRAPAAITVESTRKIRIAHDLVEDHVDLGRLLAALDVGDSGVVTPLMFEHRLLERARAANAHIVLPEGEEDRILQAAGILLDRRIARLTLLGSPAVMTAKAERLGVDLRDTRLLEPTDPGLRERFATTYAALRAHKGVTFDQALDTVTDPAFFGTLMVLEGLADGMVSGSITTTAHTIRPALQVIRTVPGMSVVSSVFFMCLADRVLVYGDCAVNPDPTAEQLADIAIASAATAAQFGIEPRIAMLSYSTGQSGSGADVEKVRAATALVRERAPGLSVEGPIQYDAAVDLAVAQTKLKGSAVAGRANVLIFPDLNTGNNTYKAVQRSASAVAIGPVLQGLNKPVNDLSRGALVRDIVNTVAITAIQAEKAGG